MEREGTEKGTRARTLLVGKNGLYALAPLTLVAQADALMEKGRVEDAVALAGQVESSEGGKPVSRPVLVQTSRTDAARAES